MNVGDLEPRHHEPPPGWPCAVFEKVTDALAAALVAAVLRAGEPCSRGEERIGSYGEPIGAALVAIDEGDR